MTQDKRVRAVRARIIETVCICFLCVILVAGLWPFHTPKNAVTWLANENGLHFGHYASIISAGSFPVSPHNASGTIELWLAPSLLRGSHTIMSFDRSAHPGVPLSVRQEKDALVVVQHNEDSRGVSWTAWSVVNGTFNGKRPVFVTIAMEPHDTSVYLDGVLAKAATILGDSTNNFTGHLILANSPSSSNSWSGEIRGMALYDRRLKQREVLEHYESWTKSRRPNITQEEAPIALYLFDERGGDTVHNEFDHRTVL
jgi:hypothetical protein